MKKLLRLLLSLAAPVFAGDGVSGYFPAPPVASMLTQRGEFYGGLSTNQRGNFVLQGA